MPGMLLSLGFVFSLPCYNVTKIYYFPFSAKFAVWCLADMANSFVCLLFSKFLLFRFQTLSLLQNDMYDRSDIG